MKENYADSKDEVLSKLLRTWKTDAQLPPRFQAAVWRQIQVANTSFWQRWMARVEAVFARPALAASYVAGLLLVGVGAGYWHAEDRSAHVQSDLRTRYVQSIDPYQMPR